MIVNCATTAGYLLAAFFLLVPAVAGFKPSNLGPSIIDCIKCATIAALIPEIFYHVQLVSVVAGFKPSSLGSWVNDSINCITTAGHLPVNILPF
jgi:hypothetical protein